MIVGPNWLGDCIMSLPAIQSFHRVCPEKRFIMLARPAMAPLWSLSPAIDETIVYSGSLSASIAAAATIRGRFDTAYVLPGSFRAGLVPFLAGIPQRIGLHGHWRPGLISKVIPLSTDAPHSHQYLEYAAIFEVKPPKDPKPEITINRIHAETAKKLLPDSKMPWIGLIPGAARGPSKCWPEDYFITIGIRLLRELKCSIVLFGSNADTEKCSRIWNGIGHCSTLNLAGHTTLPKLAALMARCALVIGNDSGGVHLAAAAGAAVIAIFGVTDPNKTRPLGAKVQILQSGFQADRNIPRRSESAIAALRSITPEMVFDAARVLF